MRVTRLKPIIDIAIPSDFLAEVPDDREAVRKIGYVGRGAAIFQVIRSSFTSINLLVRGIGLTSY
jgi:hypothetical protein